jgi:organic radical activating enzyme
MKVKINEIFRSVQGEGKYLGVPQVFVRFAGCNIECPWCDTKYASRFEEKDAAEILKIITELCQGCHSVSLTGGEPLLQWESVNELAAALRSKGLKIFLETNGILEIALGNVIDNIDIVSMDIKLPSSMGGKNFFKEHKRFLSIAAKKEVYVKTVITLETKPEDVMQSANLVRDTIGPEGFLVLQPNSDELGKELMDKCISLQIQCSRFLNNIRIIPQMHKLLGIR